MADNVESKSKHATLTADTVDSVTLSYGQQIQVVHRGDWTSAATEPIYVTTGPNAAGTPAPTVAGDDTIVVMPGVPVFVGWPGAATACVKLISAGAVPYSVQALPGPRW